MKQTLTLTKPILINGKQINELSYDPEEITALQFTEACAKATAKIQNSNGIQTIKFRENDYSLHLYLGFYSVIAINPEIDITDLERIKGFDIPKFADIGMLFTLGTSGATSEESSSDVQSENTADTSTQA